MNKVCISGIYFIFIIFVPHKRNVFWSRFSNCSFVMECTQRTHGYRLDAACTLSLSLSLSLCPVIQIKFSWRNSSARPTDWLCHYISDAIHTHKHTHAHRHTQSQSQSFHAEYLRDLSTLPTLVGTLSEILTYAVHIFMMTLKHNNSSHLRHFQSR